MSDELQIARAEVEDDGASLLVRIRVRSASRSTLHFFAAPRALHYDPASRELTVRLTQSGIEELGLVPLVARAPPMVAVDPLAEREIAIRLPRFVTRLEAGPTARAPSIVRLPAHQADGVTVEIGWSDRAFHRDPRGTAGSVHAQLQRWERGVARARWRRGPGAE